jgi:hypothetical protein
LRYFPGQSARIFNHQKQALSAQEEIILLAQRNYSDQVQTNQGEFLGMDRTAFETRNVRWWFIAGRMDFSVNLGSAAQIARRRQRAYGTYGWISS